MMTPFLVGLGLALLQVAKALNAKNTPQTQGTAAPAGAPVPNGVSA